MSVFVVGTRADRSVFLDKPLRTVLIAIGATIGLYVVGVAICRAFDAIRGPRPQPRGFDVIQQHGDCPPAEWRDGQELRVDASRPETTSEEIHQWARSLAAAAAEIPAEEHQRFLSALEDIERESKQHSLPPAPL